MTAITPATNCMIRNRKGVGTARDTINMVIKWTKIAVLES
jgi:hypothetical protein